MSKIKLNKQKQYYKGIELRLIERLYENKNAKRYLIGNPRYRQNVWIPNKHLLEDGTLKENEDIDYVFRRAYYQKKFEYAKIDINPFTWS